MKRLPDKVAIVTGGSRGIGGATVKRFVEEGAKVAIFDVLKDEGERLAKDLCAQGHDVTYQTVDITSEREVADAVNAVVTKWGQLDILVNNAAIPGANKFAHELTVEEFDRVFNVNVKGSFLCTKYSVVPMMKQNDGAIVNFSSIYGLIGNDDIPGISRDQRRDTRDDQDRRDLLRALRNSREHGASRLDHDRAVPEGRRDLSARQASATST